ncbi:S49 family peptidase [Magnetospirillum sp. UT-4]|uniref:S49 family peptidase n=1 Tax=Magnetospirillum sp. UT-4 TaxID=2681467 RepID=UPI001574ECF8|nr:S49 family peptidase [Magnetospirillum sp. UT-4]
MNEWVERFSNPPPVVTVVRLAGLIAAGGGMLRGGLNLAGQAGVLKAAFAPRRLAAVALAINSPGGSPVQSSLLGRRIRAHAEERKVPVIAFVEDVAASGGYWLAAAADEIVVDPASILGSIGVVSAGFGFHDAIARLGIERRLHTQGERKRLLDPFLPEKPEDVARLEALQGDIHEEFKAWVRERRAGRLKADEATLFDGDIWTGRRAVELGLADAIGDLRSTVRARFGDKVRILPVGRRRAWPWRGLFRGAADHALAALEERLAWARWGL